MMKTVLAALGALMLLATGNSHMLPPVDETDANASIAAVAEACRERSALAAELFAWRKARRTVTLDRARCQCARRGSA